MGDLVYGFFDCMTGEITYRKLTSGDEIYVQNDGNVPKIGDKYKDYNAIVSRLDYLPKKWWQFWKKKELFGYVVKWL